MKSLKLTYLQYDFKFPVKDEPVWKTEVDRWYQLDPFAFGLAHFYSQSELSGAEKPNMILLASPAASNETDWAFASTGAESPGKFVHTLPSVRCSPLCQVMKWTGPVLCFQKDPCTQVAAIQEAAFMLNDTYPSIWVLSVSGSKETFSAQGFVITSDVFISKRIESRFKLIENVAETKSENSIPLTDVNMWNWLSGPGHLEKNLRLGKSWTIERTTQT